MKILLENPRGVDLSADGRLAAVGGPGGPVGWRTLVLRDRAGGALPRPGWWPAEELRDVAFLGDQLTVLCGGGARAIVREGVEVARFDPGGLLPLRLAASDTGVLVAWEQAGAWVRARLPKKHKGRKHRTLTVAFAAHPMPPGLAVSRDTGLVAFTGEAPGRLTILDPVAGARLETWELPVARPATVAFSPDGRWVYAGEPASQVSVVLDRASGATRSIPTGGGLPVALYADRVAVPGPTTLRERPLLDGGRRKRGELVAGRLGAVRARGAAVALCYPDAGVVVWAPEGPSAAG